MQKWRVLGQGTSPYLPQGECPCSYCKSLWIRTSDKWLNLDVYIHTHIERDWNECDASVSFLTLYGEEQIQVCRNVFACTSCSYTREWHALWIGTWIEPQAEKQHHLRLNWLLGMQCLNYRWVVSKRLFALMSCHCITCTYGCPLLSLILGPLTYVTTSHKTLPHLFTPLKDTQCLFFLVGQSKRKLK